MSSNLFTTNKRKHESDNDAGPSHKRQKLNPPNTNTSCQNPSKDTSCDSALSLTTQYTSKNILNDDDLYLDDEAQSIAEYSSSTSPSDEYRQSEYTPHSNAYQTPMMRRRTLFTQDASFSISPLRMPCVLSTDGEQDIDIGTIIASIHRISENSLSILFEYLTFNDVLQLSKTCSAFWVQSFKLLTHLPLCCKTIYGVTNKQINRLISRCSLYLKSLDLSRTASVVNDATISAMTRHCPQLTLVSFHGCLAITDDALIVFLKRCLWIRELDISGCAQITSNIGEALALSANLRSLNMAWCTEIDCNIIPYLIYLNENHSLRRVNLHCINKFITLYPAFKHVLNAMETKCAGEDKEIEFRLKHKLFITGGLQQKTMNEVNLIKHVSYLEGKGIEYTNPETIDLRSISEFDFEYKLQLLVESEDVLLQMSGYRLYTAHNTDKIYIVIVTENGVFGTKLLPSKDFNGPREEYLAALQRSNRNPVEYLKNDCNLEHWQWMDEFQSKRSLSLLGMSRNANWIKMTTIKHCRKNNAFVINKETENGETRDPM